jgi:hypothetical protein
LDWLHIDTLLLGGYQGCRCLFDCPSCCVRLLVYVQSAGVAAYLAGHDHDLQHNIKLSNPDDDASDPLWPHHVVSGAGSETRKNEKKNYKGKVRAAGQL